MIEISITRSSNNWKSIPGNLFANNTDFIFPSDNKYGIPEIDNHSFIPEDLVMYGTPVRKRHKSVEGKTVHFFLDDYKFEPLWNRPVKTLPPIQNVGKVLSPDFSLYTNYPLALQIYNVYRSRWLAKFWQYNGIDVIPTVSWGEEYSYGFCFLGIPKHGTIALSTVGLRKPESRLLFKAGFEKMIEVLQPKRLIIHGENMPLVFEDYVSEVHYYESYWKKKRKEL